MEEYRKHLEKELEKVNALIKINNGNIEKLRGTPEGVIRIAKKRRTFQYYFKGPKDTVERYLKVSERDLAIKVVQLDYEQKASRLLKKKQKALLSAIKYIECSDVAEIFENYSEGRKQLVRPLISSTEDYIGKWYQKYPGNMNTYPINIGYETDRGEQVRSKSEKIIADMLHKYGIPYSYETEYRIGNKTTYPDFTVLNVKKRKTYIWEHLGLIDNEEYAVKNMGKLAYYEEAGIAIGQDLIITMESERIPLNIKLVEKKIKEILL
ncbi:hypothetical protein SAMN05421493_10117 [Pseudobutyrivibrio sp. 49]|uniref:hypothetical protein n=1 Tax=unclassified Pseudobutyrivibrio TaxID=2638619 RepID=UPI00088F738D|nr:MULTISPECIES: hypothetical protein [unclassified Pseudobutyrivibrio]SDH24966.1 hypothetical protein SAMN05421493_10117 [Pseudobutyrivibrio sp. 49]SFN68225.1 hypothetical protein SAMN04487831_102406 [Pseudobutyrivibrio sp. UC1225]